MTYDEPNEIECFEGLQKLGCLSKEGKQQLKELKEIDHTNINAVETKVIGKQVVSYYEGECAVCGRNFKTSGNTRYCGCEDGVQ